MRKEKDKQTRILIHSRWSFTLPVICCLISAFSANSFPFRFSHTHTHEFICCLLPNTRKEKSHHERQKLSFSFSFPLFGFPSLIKLSLVLLCLFGKRHVKDHQRKKTFVSFCWSIFHILSSPFLILIYSFTFLIRLIIIIGFIISFCIRPTSSF